MEDCTPDLPDDKRLPPYRGGKSTELSLIFLLHLMGKSKESLIEQLGVEYDGGYFSAGVGSKIGGMRESLVFLPSRLCV